MAVTIKEIAQACNVSRGTVDRVLNNRGKVKKEIDALVRKTAEDLGYSPNMAGKALAARKKNFVIGIVLVSEGIEFFEDVLEGIRQAEYEIADYGIRLCVRTMKGYQVERQVALMRQIQKEISFLILNGINDERVADVIQDFQRDKIPVITLNADVENSGRVRYIGCDFVKNGEIAAGMMGLITKGEAKIGICTGSVKILGHNQRIHGFDLICKQKYPKIEVVDIIETNDDDNIAYCEVQQMFKRHPEITALYIVAAGTDGVCRAVWESEKSREIFMIASDNTKAARRWMERGLIRVVICQQPWRQGYQAVMSAMQYLVKQTMPEKDHIVPNEIYISENIGISEYVDIQKI